MSIADLLADLVGRGVSLVREGDALKVRGPAGAVPPALRAEMAARKAEILVHLAATPADSPAPTPAPAPGGAHPAGGPAPLARRPNPSAPAPLAFNQRRLWFLDTLDGGGTAFVMVAAWVVEGALDGAALRHALTALTDRHTVLRARIRDGADGPLLVPQPPAPMGLEEEDAPGADPAALAAAEARRPFRLDAEPPFRARLFRLGEGRRLLVLAIHHIVSDRWSMGVLMRDLAALYREAACGAPAALPALPIQYADYAAWQRATLDEARLAPQVAHWREVLRDAPTGLALPLDRPRPAVRGERGGMVRFTLPAETAQALLRVARAEQATPFMALLAVYAALLARWSGQDALTVGCPAGSRDRMETQDLVGFFVNNLTLRADLADDPGFATLLRRMRAVCLDAFAHQDVPFDRVVEALNPDRALNRAPLFQAMFVLQTARVDAFTLDGATVTPVETSGGAPELDINLSLEPVGDGFAGHLEYDADLFDATTMERLARDFTRLAASAAARPDAPVSTLPLLDDAACATFAEAWSAAARSATAPPATVPALIAALAARTPDAPAVTQGDTVLSYARLEARAAALAARLAALGVGPGHVVGVATGRTPDLVVALLAVMRAGGAYVVLDPAQPAARLAAIVGDAGITLAIGPATAAGRLPDGLTLVAAEGDGPGAPVHAPEQAPDLGDLAYVCFTSGSTGVPKGVMVEHHSLANHALAVARDYGLGPGDRVLQFAAADFDVAAEEIFPTLLAGAALALRDPGAVEDLDAFTADAAARGISVLNLPAPFWHAWVRHLAEAATPLPPALRLVVTGSDRVSAERLAEWRALAGPRVSWRNGYGPTEATITATLFDPAVDRAPEAGTVPIGRPIDNVRVAVLNPAGRPVPPGVVGEIVIGGPGVARGYLNRPDETAARFRPDPFVPGARTFWTGDLGRARADGVLEFVGRRDDQVKIRGIRIEPGEIATALLRQPGVSDAAVLALPDAAGQPRLVAFAETGTETGAEAGASTAATLLDALRRALPAAMVPAAVVPLARLPRTAAGKADRRALAALAPGEAPAAARVAPRDGTEHTLAGIFAAVLGVAEVGIHDNFFDLGGDSIRSLQIVSRARQAGLELTVRTVFQHQTVAGLAAALDAAPDTATRHDATRHMPADGPVPATPIQAWFHSAITEDAHHYNQSVLLAVPADLDPAALERAIDALIDHHDSLRLRVADGAQSIPPAAGRYGMLAVHEGDGAEAAFAAAQAGFDLARGPLLRAVLARRDGRLLLTAHHLAVDAVSWSILLDDLAAAYEQAARGQAPALPAKTTPFRVWAERLSTLAASPALAEEAAFWTDALSGPAVPLLGADTDPGTVGDAGHLALDLDAAATAALRRDLPAAFAAKPDEALLAALQRAVWRLTGGTRLRVDVERHGRADLFDDVDLSRTVGWFTSVQPVLLDFAGPGDPRGDLAAVGARLRAAPRDGLGFGLLPAPYSEADRHADPRAALAALPAAEVLVNYLGELDAAAAGPFTPVDGELGPMLSPRARRSHAFELNAGIRDGRLRLDLTHPPGAGTTAAALAEETLKALGEIAAAARAEAGTLPLTPLQQGVLAHSLRDPDTYFDQLRLVLDGPLDAGALRAAWAAVLERHDALRATFHWRDVPQPAQIIAGTAALPWREADWRALPAAEQRARMDELLAADRAEGFVLERAPLMRLHLVRTADSTHELVWSAHHLLMDGWSVSVLAGEVFALYAAAVAGRAAELPDAPRFGDYVRWLAGRDTTAALAFWRAELVGVEAATPILLPGLAPDPADHPRAAGAELCLRLDEAETAALAALAKRGRVTLGTVMQGAWALLLGRYTGQRDVVFGVTVSGRPPELAGAEGMVGMLINTVPARVAIADDQPALAWLQGLFARHVERDRFGATPLADIARASDLPAGAELFHSLLLFQNYPASGTLEAGGVRLSAVQAYERTNFPLTLACQPGPALELVLHYEPRHFTAAAVRGMLDHLRTLLAAMAATPDAPLARLPLLDAAERAAALAAGRGAVEAVDPAFAHELVAHWATERPDAPALEGHDAALSYRELAGAVDALAARLAASGVGVGTPVGLCLRRSARLAVAFLAVLRAGGTVVPLDPAYPAERLRFMLADSGTRLVLSDGGAAASIPDTGVPVIRLDRPDGEDGPPAAWTPPALDASAVAYLIYTSGSTGTPKGVESTHGGLRNLIHAQRRLFGLGGGDRVLQFASPSFDASVWEIAMALGAGATLLLPAPDATRPGPDLARTLAEARVSAATLPPTALSVLPEDSLPELRLLVVAGEACAPELARRWAAGRRFVNGYGPTESSVCATADEGGGDGVRLPIGRPLPNIAVHLLDDRGEPVPDGVPGELHIGGAGLARGYRDRPELTAERFITWPATGERLYRTGDLGYRLADGRIQFIGRTDHQVKLRGFRIELGEVEAVLAAHPAVRGAAALVRGDRLVAYAATDADEATLRAHLRGRLPEHMVPARLVLLPALPLTPNGKIDRKALPDPDAVARPAAPGGNAPRTAAERTLADIWAAVLGVETVGADDAFFDLGGDSILAIQVVARANQAGLPITLNQLLTPGQQTIAALVAAIGDGGGGDGDGGNGDAPAAGTEAEPDGPVTVPATPIQRWFLDLAAPDPHHYNQGFLLEVPGDIDPDRLEHAARAVLRHHDALRLTARRTPEGWTLWLTPPAAAPGRIVSVHDLGPLAGDAARAAIEAASSRAQAGFDLAAGPLLRLDLLRLGPGEPARLLVAVHHLAVDAVSWRVLLDDLFDGYRQAADGEIRLPPRTTSWRRWAERLAEPATVAAARKDLPAWLTPRPPLARLPLAAGGETVRSRVGDAVRLERVFDAEATEALLRALPKRTGASAHDALLAALAAAMTRTLGGDALLVDLEGHGRDAPVAGVDLTRTVGWFTTLAPAVLPVQANAGTDAALAAVRGALAAMPGRGFGWGVLRHLCDDPLVREALNGLEPAEVAFNYLGQWDQSWPTAMPVRPAAESEGPGFAPTTPRPYRLEVAALVAGGRLRMDWTYDPRQLDPALVERLADAYGEALHRLLTPPAGAEGATGADGGTHPLAPQQAAMLAHALAHPDSEAYVVQLGATLPGDLDVAAFQAAWQRLLDRHAALRACFVAGPDGAPRQRFPDRVAPPWRLEDWRGEDAGTVAGRFRALMAADRHAGLDPAAAPMMRFTLARADDGHRFLWTHHHLLMDGWSMPILLNEVLRGYAGTAPSAPAPDFRDFLAWLGRQDTAAASAFWKDELAGAPPPVWPPSRPEAGRRFAELVRRPPAATGRGLAAYARRHRLTVPAVIMGAWALLLARRTGSADVTFGVTAALRPPELAGVESMVGPLINTLPLRVAVPDAVVAGGVPAPAWFAALQRRRAAQAAHAHAPLGAVAAAAGPGGAPFATTLRVQTYPAGKDTGEGLRFADVVMVDLWHYPLNLEVVPGETPVLAACYDTAALDADQAAAVLDEFAALLAAIAGEAG